MLLFVGGRLLGVVLDDGEVVVQPLVLHLEHMLFKGG